MPVIWHDNYIVHGEEAAPTSSLIADLTADQFRRLAPINGGGGGGGDGLAGGMSAVSLAGPDTPFGGSPVGGSPMGGSPAGSTISLSSLDSSATASTASSAARAAARLLRKHRNGEPAVAGEPTLRAWRCEQEDHFPTLAEVRLSRGLARGRGGRQGHSSARGLQTTAAVASSFRP